MPQVRRKVCRGLQGVLGRVSCKVFDHPPRSTQVNDCCCCFFSCPCSYFYCCCCCCASKCRHLTDRHLQRSARVAAFADAKMQMVAEYWAQLFNTKSPPEHKVSFVCAQVLELPSRPDGPLRWSSLEPLLSGECELLFPSLLLSVFACIVRWCVCRHMYVHYLALPPPADATCAQMPSSIIMLALCWGGEQPKLSRILPYTNPQSNYAFATCKVSVGRCLRTLRFTPRRAAMAMAISALRVSAHSSPLTAATQFAQHSSCQR